MSIVGLDLAGVETRPTGFCSLSDICVETSLIYTDKEIIDKIVGIHPKIIAVDAPLCLPPGRNTIEERTNIHLRESDKKILKKGIRLFPITLGPMRKLTLRGMFLKNVLEAREFIVIEAYPGGAQDILGIPRKQHGLEKLKSGLEKLGFNGLKREISHHELDAITCAYVGKLFLEGNAVTYGGPNQGIVMPKGERFSRKRQ